ncbi:chemotaxis protein CheW [Alteromonas sp. V450]|uniref:chemotaxis protein CheW n=1 Tax=Alteromonas sp. V450 TaxID=1912139 RepID=UPI0008FF601D|nr:chemotaxis protein CheW [Alteromonas sp. V450]OJF67389.1 chemotaxis protein CheW [Alteromonas sp. V450]
MSKQSPFAREEVMEAYLDSLLKEPEVPQDVTARTAKLLEQASQQIADEVPSSPLKESSNVEPDTLSLVEEVSQFIGSAKSNHGVLSESDSHIEEESQELRRIEETTTKLPLKDTLGFRFQALFFEVAGLTLAVPLTSLGGIHQIEKIGPLFGKPDWFMGVMLHRESKLSVVDTAKWVMPEKYDESLAQSIEYRYLIMLGESAWGLASEKLVNTVNLTTDDVKWRETTGKRPWLAGMVKEKMCALIDVEELISMLNKGLGSNDQTP